MGAGRLWASRLWAAVACLLLLVALGLVGAVAAQGFEEPPQVQSAQPDIGPIAGGTTVTIQGRGFGGATAVRFGATQATSFRVTRNPDDSQDLSDYDEITAVSPPQAEGLVHVTVTTPLGTSQVNGDCSDSGPNGLSAPPCDEFSYYGALGGGTWATTGVQAKGGIGRATVLLNGKVLFTGAVGINTYDLNTGRTAISGAELYDPATGRWSSCPEATASPDCPGPMIISRGRHTATLLTDGRVLIAGGDPSSASAEIYDPATGKFTKTGDLGTRRTDHTASLLPDGGVLVAGGVQNADEGDPTRGNPGVPGNTTEIYNPSTRLWTPGKPFPQGVAEHAAVSLAGGKVLLFGGRRPTNPTNATDTDASQLYDPVGDAWTSCMVETTAMSNCPGPLVHARYRNSATVLADGRVLAAGGVRADGVVTHSSAELYDPNRGIWTDTGRMGQARAFQVAARLPNGRVLVAGGFSRFDSQFNNRALNSAELYDPAGGRWSWAPFMLAANATVAAALPTGPWTACARNCGKVLVVRGNINGGPDLPSLLFAPAPELAASTSPPAGPAGGGTPVAITGTGLASVSSVKFDGVEAQRIDPDAQNPDGRLVAVTPPHAASAVGTPVAVTVTADGGSATTRFVYVPDVGGGGGGSVPGPIVGGGAVGSLTQATTPGSKPVGRPPSRGVPSVSERSAVKRCLAAVASHARRERRLARRGSARRRARVRRHLRRHAASGRRRCFLPGRVRDLKARALSASTIMLTFSTPGSVASSPPPAGRYILKQSLRPITSERDFRRAGTLCGGLCRFRPTRLGQRINLTVTGLRPHATYYYAIKAVGASGHAGARSRTARATTRRGPSR